MQRIFSILIVFVSILFSNVFAAGKIFESYYVYSTSPSLKKSITMNKDLILDHTSSKGFELYGPRGLGAYLSRIKVKYTDLNSLESIFTKSNKGSYPSYTDVVQRLKTAVAKYPNIMSMFSVGKTVKGRDLWVIKISDNVNKDEVEPEFKYISSMHGDEIVGRELMQNLIEDIGAAYVSGDNEITSLVNNAEIFIMPSMNPDGSELVQRWNGNNVDLNRNFPDPFAIPNNSSGSRQNSWNSGFQGGRNPASINSQKTVYEPETQAVMNFQAERNFALSANFHGGAVVFNYAWDAISERHPLDDFLIDISLEYSKLNEPMYNSTEFKNGITNGADWYIVRGGMQDWSYVNYNDLQFTIELSNVKYPDFSKIPQFYKENKESMIGFMENVFQGTGFYWENKKTENGLVEVLKDGSRSLGKFPWKKGEFYKVLPAGKYTYAIYSNTGTLLKKIDVAVAQSPNSKFYTLL